MEKETIVTKFLGPKGFLISSSKGRYSFENPKNLVVFNANLCTKTGKIWYGDIDITEDEDALRSLAKTIDEPLYVLYEQDGRFENETSPKLKKCVAFIDQFGIKLNHNIKKYFERVDGKILKKPEPKQEKIKYKPREYNSEEYTSFRCNISSLKTNTKLSPIEQLYKKVMDYVKTRDKISDKPKLSVDDVYMTETDFEKLREQFGNWLINYHKTPPDSYEYNKHISWIVMDMPCVFYNEELPWIKPNHIYVRTVKVQAND